MTKRPPDRRSTEAAALAMWSGWRTGSTIDPVASAISRVWAAIQPSQTQGS